MGPDGVVILFPCRERGSGVPQRRKQGFVEQFVPQPAVEAFHEGVLRRLAWRYVVLFDLPVLAPTQHRHGGQFRPVIADHCVRPATLGHEHVQLACHPQP